MKNHSKEKKTITLDREARERERPSLENIIIYFNFWIGFDNLGDTQMKKWIDLMKKRKKREES